LAFPSESRNPEQTTLTDSEAVLALVSPELFSTLHIPLLIGRVFNQTEVMNAAHVALVNQAFVKEYLAGPQPARPKRSQSDAQV